jgi:hypothetical protein
MAASRRKKADESPHQLERYTPGLAVLCSILGLYRLADIRMSETAVMIEQAKAERLTFERLAIDARQLKLTDDASAHKAFMANRLIAARLLNKRAISYQLLVDTYCRSIIRLNAIIRIAEMQLGERKT